jgi:hypothetical protein
MQIGVQFTGAVPARSIGRWFTHSWPAEWNVVWTVVPTTPAAGAPQIAWDVEVQRSSPTALTYWIEVKNLTAASVGVEGRFAILP